NCNAKFNLADELAGKKVKCQSCSHVFVVPRSAESAPPVLKAADEPDDGGIIAKPAKADSIKAGAKPPPGSSRNDDDDDDDDDRPRKRRPAQPAKSGGGMLTLVLVLLGGAVLGCLACVGVVGYWFV